MLGRQLVVVTGKGGVGKSTVAAALGLVAAGRGLRTIVAEVARRDDVSRALGGEGMHEEELAPGLHHLSIDPEHAMELYLADQLPAALAELLGSSRAFSYLAAATPGMRELLTVGKLWELAQDERRTPGAERYDLVIVDAPATGQGIGFLQTPRTFANIARVGPIHSQAQQLDRFITDQENTGTAIVALPEEMPVNETMKLERDLRDEVGVAVDRVYLNGLYPERFKKSEAEVLAQLAEDENGAAKAAARAALSEHGRAKTQRSQLNRLKRGVEAPVKTLPFLFEPELDVEAARKLAGKLG